MYSEVAWDKPQKWHLGLSSEKATILERSIAIVFFAGLTAIGAQLYFKAPWNPDVPYTFQTFTIFATGAYLRRNDAFMSASLYLLVGAIGYPVFAGGNAGLFDGGSLIASGGYLLAFPFAAALIAEGLDRSRKASKADVKAQVICWSLAMIPIYLFGTVWLSTFIGMEAAFIHGTLDFIFWDAFKIFLMALVTTYVWSYE